ncbi:TlpA disulfide reductase family protein [Parapedobacter sp. ISTM3]|uniref:TlpA family protein disulfide reductase n=1 Tax=Parapedobacter sp. ISTM3 TaxID=2800130 RepID=UPI001F28AC29|nr:TlpA disulfide reductase family protein [Parapedobacter sp. ISTM3]
MVSDSSLTLLIYNNDYLPRQEAVSPIQRMKPIVDQGYYIFDFELPDSIVVVTLINGKSHPLLIDRFVAESGDNILIEKTESGLVFRGYGAEKYNFSNRLSVLENAVSDSLSVLKSEEINRLKREGQYGYRKLQDIYFKNSAIVLDDMLNEIGRYQSRYSKSFIDMLKAEVIGRVMKQPISAINFYYGNGNLVESVENWEYSLEVLDKYNFLSIRDKIFAFSPTFVETVYDWMRLESYLKNKFSDFQSIAEKNTDGFLREKVLTLQLLTAFSSMGEQELRAKIDEGFPSIQYVAFKSLLENVSIHFSKGNIFPEFTLPDDEGNLVSLGDFKGKVVYLHFWFKGCAACAMLYRNTLSDIEKYYKMNRNVVFVSVSVDKNKQTWLRAIEENKYTAPGGINLYTQGEGFQHEICKVLNVSAAPTAYLIDKNGRLISSNMKQLGGGKDTLISLIDSQL